MKIKNYYNSNPVLNSRHQILFNSLKILSKILKFKIKLFLLNNKINRITTNNKFLQLFFRNNKINLFNNKFKNSIMQRRMYNNKYRNNNNSKPLIIDLNNYRRSCRKMLLK